MRFTLSRWESVRDDIVIRYALGFASVSHDAWIKRRANVENNILLVRLQRDYSSTFESTSRQSRVAQLSLSRYTTLAQR